MLLNKERAADIMEKYGLDIIIATSAENVLYSADYFSELPFCRRWAFQGYAVLPRVGEEATLIVPFGALPLLAEQPSWMTDIRAYGGAIEEHEPDAVLSPGEKKYEALAASVRRGPSAFQLLLETLREKGFSSSKIGLDEGSMLATEQARLRDDLPDAEIVDAFGILREIRMVKTEEEIERISQVIKVNENAMLEVIDVLSEGVSEKEIVRVYDAAVGKHGGIPRVHQLGAGTRGVALFAPSGYRTRKGDLIYLDPVCTHNFYWSDMSRSVVIGEPSKKQSRYYDAMRKGVEAGIAAVRPGVKVSEIYEVVMDAIRKNGIPHLRRTHCGHGIGLEFYEPPVIKPAGTPTDSFLPHITDVTLEENMVVNVEAPYYEFGFGTLQLEDTVRVSATGSECLTTLSREFWVC